MWDNLPVANYPTCRCTFYKRSLLSMRIPFKRRLHYLATTCYKLNSVVTLYLHLISCLIFSVVLVNYN